MSGTLAAVMGGLLHLVQRRGEWAGPQPAQAPPRYTKCNSPPIGGAENAGPENDVPSHRVENAGLEYDGPNRKA